MDHSVMHAAIAAELVRAEESEDYADWSTLSRLTGRTDLTITVDGQPGRIDDISFYQPPLVAGGDGDLLAWVDLDERGGLAVVARLGEGDAPAVVTARRGATPQAALEALLAELPEMAGEILTLLYREPGVAASAATALEVLAAGGDLDAVRAALAGTHISPVEVVDLDPLRQAVDERMTADGQPWPGGGPRGLCQMADWLAAREESSLLRRAASIVRVLRARGPAHIWAHIARAGRQDTGHGSSDLLLEVEFTSSQNGMGGGRAVALAGHLPLHETGSGVVGPIWYPDHEWPRALVMATHGSDGVRTLFVVSGMDEVMDLAWELARQRLTCRALDGQYPVDEPRARPVDEPAAA